MKYLIKIIPLIAFTTILVVGCNTDELKELNINPQTVPEIDMNFFFTAAQLGAASSGSSGDNRYIDWRTNIGMNAYAIQHLANVSGGIAPGDKYQHNAETSNAPFEHMYGDQLKNIAEIFRQTGEGGFEEGQKVNMRNATRILKAFLFHRLTDYYGSIPYFEALKANTVEKIYFPKYDKQKDIYADLLKELDEAATALSESNPDEGFSNADLYYKGDIAKWKKWAYSLMLRLAMRVSNVDPAMANTYVAKAVAGGVFTSNDDNVIVPMAIEPSLWTNQNGISRAFFPGDGNQPTYLSKTLVDWLKGTNPASEADDDPRLMILSGGIGYLKADKDDETLFMSQIPTPNGPKDPMAYAIDDPLLQKGMPNGKNNSTLAQYEGLPVGEAVNQDLTYSKINLLLLNRDEPYMLMNYGEVELLLAEAAERSIGGLSPGQAQARYNAGVTASMQMYTVYDATLEVSGGDVANYLANYPYAGSPQQKLEMIGEQLWVNKFLNWWDAWSDWRRTGYPALTPVVFPGNVTGGTIPVRLRYPVVEATSNSVNFEAGATTPDEYTTKVWWAGGPE